MTLRTLLLSVLGLVLTALAPLGAPAAATPAPAAEPGHSYLAVVDRGPAAEYGGVDARSQRLVLFSPTGEPRTVYSRKVSRRYGGFRLLDWSADASTALLVVPERSRPVLLRVDVATGAVLPLAVRRLDTAVLDPSGVGVLVSVWEGRRNPRLVLDRIDWTGARSRLRDATNGIIVPGRAGTVITGAPGGRTLYLLSAADGTVLHSFRGRGFCTPVRWWDATRLLSWCGKHGDLHLLDPATGSGSRLTSQHAKGDYGHLDARLAGGRLFVQAAGGCGYAFVGRQTRSGAVRHLRVPGAVGSVLLVDAVGSRLVLQHAASCDGDQPRSVLTLFDPVHRDETDLIRLGRHEAFNRIMVQGEVRASTY